MRGVRLSSFGEGEPGSRLEVRDDLLVPPLNPSTDDVLVRVEATSVNPIDLDMRKGYARQILFRARAKESPMTLGFDCVGALLACLARTHARTHGHTFKLAHAHAREQAQAHTA
jgi:NADPH:quinone reductase-like Zn-dependent oxidoreductase